MQVNSDPIKVINRWFNNNSMKVEWNIGKRCNYDCSYCPSEIHDNVSSHTDIELMKETVDVLVGLGKNIKLSLTGGEPTVHPKIEELLAYIKDKGINWLNITSNGTRPAKWYIENQQYYNHLNFSLHFEYDWKRVLENITETHLNVDKDHFVNVMAHHDKMDYVREVSDYFDEYGIPYAIRRIRWTEGDRDIFDDMKYHRKDLEWLLSKNSTATPNCEVFFKNNKSELMHSNDIIKLHLNKYKGWSCNAGLESLMINWDGEVHRATCRVGNSLGNIYYKTFVVPTDPIICDRNNCTCAADIPLTKFSL